MNDQPHSQLERSDVLELLRDKQVFIEIHTHDGNSRLKATLYKQDDATAPFQALCHGMAMGIEFAYADEIVIGRAEYPIIIFTQ